MAEANENESERLNKAASTAQNRASDLAAEARGRAGEAARTASEQSGAMARDAQGRAADLAKNVQNRASDVAGKARDAVSDVAGTLAEQAGPQKEQAAEAMDKAAGAAWRAAHSLRDADQHWLSQVVGVAAEQLAGMADAVRENDLRAVSDRVQQLAKDQPAVFVGASVAAGFALARIARLALDSPRPASAQARSAGTTGASNANLSEFPQTTERRQDSAPATTYPGTNYNV